MVNKKDVDANKTVRNLMPKGIKQRSAEEVRVGGMMLLVSLSLMLKPVWGLWERKTIFPFED